MWSGVYENVMVWLDIAIYIVLIWAIVSGLWTGAIRRVVFVACLLVALSEGWRLSPWVQYELLPWLDVAPEDIAPWLVVLLSSVLIFLVLYMIGRLLTSVLERGAIGLINRLAGAVLSLIIAIYGMGMLFSFVEVVLPIRAPREDERREATDVRLRSSLYAPIKASIADIDKLRARAEELRLGGK